MVVGEGHAKACAEAVPEVPAGQVIAEPRGRNTAPAILLAAIHLQKFDPDAVMVVLPADHFVREPSAFADALRRAVPVAEEGHIVTLGIEPTYAETGYGYIERGEQQLAPGVFGVSTFREKPDAATAEDFIRWGTFQWNAGIFVMGAGVFLAEVKRQRPELLLKMDTVRDAIGTPRYTKLLGDAYEMVEPISIDHGIIEGAERVAVVPVDCGWNDVGSFAALGEVLNPDARGNVLVGDLTRAIESNNCLGYSESGKRLVLLGLENVVAVESEGAILVMPKERSQDVRQVVKLLIEEGAS
jgi:mannose-1-phosphate guanylyltransferase